MGSQGCLQKEVNTICEGKTESWDSGTVRYRGHNTSALTGVEGSGKGAQEGRVRCREVLPASVSIMGLPESTAASTWAVNDHLA